MVLIWMRVEVERCSGVVEGGSWKVEDGRWKIGKTQDVVKGENLGCGVPRIVNV